MKKRNIKWLLPGVAAVLAGCSPDGILDNVPAPAPGGGERTYTVSVGAASPDGGATRAEYDGVTYRWSPGDRAGFYMVPAGTDTPVVNNALLKSMNTSAVQTADFEGEITASSIERIAPGGRYDYYSYFPYDGNAAGAAFPNAAFEIPNEITLAPDVFPTEYGFMVAEKVTTADGGKPATWLGEDGRQRFGERIGFRYRHVFAYLEVHLALNLMSQPINKIVVTCIDGGPVSGVAHVNVQTGAVSFPSGSNTLTVNIPAGMDIRSATDYDRIWIPINPELAGKQFKFDFYSVHGNTASQTVTGGTLQAGMKHKAGLKVPWVCNFSDLADRNDSWGSDNITHKGYSFWCWNVNPGFGDGNILRPGTGGILAFNDNDGELRTPAINMANTLGLENVNVKVTVYASGNDPLIWPFNGGRRMKYGICDLDQATFSNGEWTLPLNRDIRYSSFDGTMTSSKNCVGFKANVWGAYYNYIQEIKIEPI